MKAGDRVWYLSKSPGLPVRRIETTIARTHHGGVWACVRIPGQTGVREIALQRLHVIEAAAQEAR